MSEELEALSNLRFFIKHTNPVYEEELDTIENVVKVLELVKREPEELGFVTQSPTYQDYLQTYKDAKIALNDVVYTEDEFIILKNYFKREE